jgi:hypothetical protein
MGETYALAVLVTEDEASLIVLLDSPRRREAAELCYHVLPAHSRAISKITKAPGITRSNTNWKNGVTWVISGAPPARPSLGAPIFFRLTPHGGCDRILDLEPVIEAARTVRRTETFRDNAFAAEGAGVLKDDRSLRRRNAC